MANKQKSKVKKKYNPDKSVIFGLKQMDKIEDFIHEKEWEKSKDNFTVYIKEIKSQLVYNDDLLFLVYNIILHSFHYDYLIVKRDNIELYNKNILNEEFYYQLNDGLGFKVRNLLKKYFNNKVIYNDGDIVKISKYYINIIVLMLNDYISMITNLKSRVEYAHTKLLTYRSSILFMECYNLLEVKRIAVYECYNDNNDVLMAYYRKNLLDIHINKYNNKKAIYDKIKHNIYYLSNKYIDDNQIQLSIVRNGKDIVNDLFYTKDRLCN